MQQLKGNSYNMRVVINAVRQPKTAPIISDALDVYKHDGGVNDIPQNWYENYLIIINRNLINMQIM